MRDLHGGEFASSEPGAGALAEDFSACLDIRIRTEQFDGSVRPPRQFADEDPGLDLVGGGGEGEIERVAETDRAPDVRVGRLFPEREFALKRSRPGRDVFEIRHLRRDREVQHVALLHRELADGFVLDVLHAGGGPLGRRRVRFVVLVDLDDRARVAHHAVAQDALAQDAGGGALDVVRGARRRVGEGAEERAHGKLLRDGGDDGREFQAREPGDELDFGVLEIAVVVHDRRRGMDRDDAVVFLPGVRNFVLIIIDRVRQTVIEFEPVERRPSDPLGQITHADGAYYAVRDADDLDFLGLFDLLRFRRRLDVVAFVQALRVDLHHVGLPDSDETPVFGFEREEARAERGARFHGGCGRNAEGHGGGPVRRKLIHELVGGRLLRIFARQGLLVADHAAGDLRAVLRADRDLLPLEDVGHGVPVGTVARRIVLLRGGRGFRRDHLFDRGAAEPHRRRVEPECAVAGGDVSGQGDYASIMRLGLAERGDLARYEAEAVLVERDLHDRGVVGLLFVGVLSVLFGCGLPEERGGRERGGEDDAEDGGAGETE